MKDGEEEPMICGNKPCLEKAYCILLEKKLIKKEERWTKYIPVYARANSGLSMTASFAVLTAKRNTNSKEL